MNEKISFDSIINTFVQKNTINKKFAHTFLKEMALVIEQGLIRDNIVNLNGFGIFKLRQIPERSGRNIQTGETIRIPAHRKVLFKPEKHLRELINKNYQHLKPTFFSNQEEFDSAGIILKDDPASYTDKSFNGVAEETTKQESTVIVDSTENENKKEVELAALNTKPESPEEEKVLPGKSVQIIIALIVILTILFIYFQFNDKDTITDSSLKSKENLKSVITETQKDVGKDSKTANTKKTISTSKKKTISSSKTHKAEDGDNLWNLAYKYYNDGYLWPLILQENIEKIKNPDIFQSGINITIPSVTKKNDNRLLAKGHLLAYREYKKNNDSEAINHLYVAYKIDKDFVTGSSNVSEIDLKSVKMKFGEK